MRERLTTTRRSITHKMVIHSQGGKCQGYITVGLYDDGRPGELFIHLEDALPGIRGMAQAWALAISLCLQAGVTAQDIVRKFGHQRFEPAGMTENPDIPFAKSIVDYIARFLGKEFTRTEPEAHGPTSLCAPEGVGPGQSLDLTGAATAAHGLTSLCAPEGVGTVQPPCPFNNHEVLP